MPGNQTDSDRLDVRRATGGQLEISVHANGSLIKHPDMLRAVSAGQVNIAEFLLGQFGNEAPVFAADNLPFVAAGSRSPISRAPSSAPTARRRHALPSCSGRARR